jgi:hypothetical protein
VAIFKKAKAPSSALKAVLHRPDSARQHVRRRSWPTPLLTQCNQQPTTFVYKSAQALGRCTIDLDIVEEYGIRIL